MSTHIDREAWIRLRCKDEMPSRTGGYNFGFHAAMGRLIATHGRIGKPFITLFREIMFAEGVLSRQEREMVAAVAAAAQDCYY